MTFVFACALFFAALLELGDGNTSDGMMLVAPEPLPRLGASSSKGDRVMTEETTQPAPERRWGVRYFQRFAVTRSHIWKGVKAGPAAEDQYPICGGVRGLFVVGMEEGWQRRYDEPQALLDPSCRRCRERGARLGLFAGGPGKASER